MVEHENLALKLPARFGIDARRHHHHPLPDRGALDLKSNRKSSVYFQTTEARANSDTTISARSTSRVRDPRVTYRCDVTSVNACGN